MWTPLGSCPHFHNHDDGDDDAERRQVAWSPDGTALTFLQMDPAPEDDEADAPEDSVARAAAVWEWMQ